MELTNRQIVTIMRMYRLSPQETELVKLLCEGINSNKILAERMKISVFAVKLYLHHLYIKLGTNNKLAVTIKIVNFLLQSDVKSFNAVMLRRRRN